MIDVLMRDLRQPEYIHVLINPVPVYGLAVALIGLVIAILLRSRSGQRRHDKAWVLTGTHDLGLEDHTPRVCPRLCGIGELVIKPATGGRRLAMGPGERDGRDPKFPVNT